MEIIGNSSNETDAGSKTGQNDDGGKDSGTACTQIFMGRCHKDAGAVGKLTGQVTVRFRSRIPQEVIDDGQQGRGNETRAQTGPDQIFFAFNPQCLNALPGILSGKGCSDRHPEARPARKTAPAVLSRTVLQGIPAMQVSGFFPTSSALWTDYSPHRS